MSLYIQRQLQLKAGQTATIQNPIIDRGNSGIDRISAQTHLAEATTGRIVLAAGATDTQIALGQGIATGRLFYLETDQDITVKLGGTEAARALSVKIPVDAVVGTLYMDVEYTSVYLTNGGTSDANLYYAIVGA